MKESTEKLDFIKIKSFCSVQRMKKQATAWEKIFVNDTSDKGLLFKIYELLKLNNKNTGNAI